MLRRPRDYIRNRPANRLHDAQIRRFEEFSEIFDDSTVHNVLEMEAFGYGNLGVIDVFLLVSIESHDIADDTERTRDYLHGGIRQQLDNVGDNAGGD